MVVEDRLEPAVAITVLNGHLPFRAMEAAELYRAGWAPQVALIRSHLGWEDRTLQELGIHRPQEWDWSREVLIRMGVPPSAIRFIDGHPRTTDEEVRTSHRPLQKRNGLSSS
ncbi:MAG: YdcF family protein [Acidobacteria bacterium]|nr:YdcF family protein [Acidobacteriota bacterium]